MVLYCGGFTDFNISLKDYLLFQQTLNQMVAWFHVNFFLAYSIMRSSYSFTPPLRSLTYSVFIKHININYPNFILTIDRICDRRRKNQMKKILNPSQSMTEKRYRGGCIYFNKFGWISTCDSKHFFYLGVRKKDCQRLQHTMTMATAFPRFCHA